MGPIAWPANSSLLSVVFKTSVTLQAASVYTLFMSANGATVSGTLRKDR